MVNNEYDQLELGYEGNPNTVNDYYDTSQKVIEERFYMTSIANYDLYTWGRNVEGQLGLGNQSWPDGGFASSPQKVDFLDKNDNLNNESSSGFIWIYLLIIIIIIATISLIIGIIFKIKKNKE